MVAGLKTQRSATAPSSNTPRSFIAGRTTLRGNKDAARKWTNDVIEQTEELPVIEAACILKITFLLPPDKFPKDFRYGPDLDNLLKRFLDALGQTIFKSSHGGDSCIISVQASKARVASKEEAGAMVEIIPMSV